MAPPRPPVLPSVTAAQERYHADLVDEVAKVVAAHEVVVVGVSGLQPGRRARRLLEAENIPHRYLQYGSYLRGWRRRLALKLWVGWPTFPLIFVKGTFIGGASDLRRLSQTGELKKMLANSGG
ncbi:MAG: glutaredoxin [Myxococcota bacterium]|nr:glutaredoxin [Myxococcota bacterium]